MLIYTLARVIHERRAALVRRHAHNTCTLWHTRYNDNWLQVRMRHRLCEGALCGVQLLTLFGVHPPRKKDALEDLEGEKCSCTVMGSSSEFILKY
jgi:hypothetical protein